MNPSRGTIILAGGECRRIKFPKPFLRQGGKTFLQIIAEAYRRGGVSNIVVVLNRQWISAEWNSELDAVRSLCTIVENAHPEKGRTYSLITGARKMAPVDYCFIQNVDNPFIETGIIRALWEKRNRDGFTSPVCRARGGHPVLISKRIMDHILTIHSLDLTLRQILASFGKSVVETNDERILININTPEDYEKYCEPEERRPLVKIAS